MRIKVFYQKFQLNAGVFHADDVAVVPGRETLIINLTVDELKELGYEFEDGCDYGEYSQAIFEILNLRPEEMAVRRYTFKEAGHTSMSVGDYIVYQPTFVKDNFTCHVCAPAGWKVIEDYVSFEARHGTVMNAVTHLPIDVIDAMAKLYNQDPLAFKKEFEHFTDKEIDEDKNEQ